MLQNPCIVEPCCLSRRLFNTFFKRPRFPGSRHRCSIRASRKPLPPPSKPRPVERSYFILHPPSSTSTSRSSGHGRLLRIALHESLHLHFRHRGPCARQIGGGSLGILGIVVRDRRLDRVFRKHGAVHYPQASVFGRHHPTRTAHTLYRRQAQFSCNLRVPDLARILQSHPSDKLRKVRTARDGAPAAKCLEFDIADGIVVGIDFDL